MEAGASLIDDNSVISGIVIKKYNTGEKELFSSCFDDMFVDQFGESFSSHFWQEDYSEFVTLLPGSMLEPATGYYMLNLGSDVRKQFQGILSTGDIFVGLTRNYEGINFVGNLYSSSLDWDLLELCGVV